MPAKNNGYKDIVTRSQLKNIISNRLTFCNILPVLFTYYVASISNQFLLSACDHLQVGIFMTEGEK